MNFLSPWNGLILTQIIDWSIQHVHIKWKKKKNVTNKSFTQIYNTSTKTSILTTTETKDIFPQFFYHNRRAACKFTLHIVNLVRTPNRKINYARNLQKKKSRWKRRFHFDHLTVCGAAFTNRVRLNDDRIGHYVMLLCVLPRVIIMLH